MSHHVSQKEINDIVWRACDTFRGAVDPSEYKNYILTMLFIKYMSDLWKDKKEEYEKKYKGDMSRVERALARERFVVPPESDFDSLYSKRDEPNIGEIINIALEKIEDANKSKLENVFRNIDFNSEPALGQTRERNRRLKNLLEDFADERLDLRPSRIRLTGGQVGNRDVIGDVYEYLISRVSQQEQARRPVSSTPHLKFLHCLPGCSLQKTEAVSVILPVDQGRSSLRWDRKSAARTLPSSGRSPTAPPGPCAG